MKYGQIRKLDVANGPGIRVSLFVTGCNFNCYNCFNKEYQDFEYGKVFGLSEWFELIDYLNNPHISGLSILGGEPLEHSKYLEGVVKYIRPMLRDDQDIWLWSGYTFEEILLDQDKLKLIKHIDILVDGTFQNDKKDLNLKFRGSSNQRIIDIEKSLKSGRVEIWKG